MALLVSVITQSECTAAGVNTRTKTPDSSRARLIAAAHFSPGRMLSGAIQGSPTMAAQVVCQPLGERRILVRMADEDLFWIPFSRTKGRTPVHRNRPELSLVLLRPILFQRRKEVGDQPAPLAVIQE